MDHRRSPVDFACGDEAGDGLGVRYRACRENDTGAIIQKRLFNATNGCR